MQPIENFVRRFSHVPDEEIHYLKSRLTLKNLKRNEHFVVSGKESNQLGFVAQGLFKVYYLDHRGREFIRIFHAEGSPLGDYTALIRGELPIVNIQALEESKVLTIPFPDFRGLFERHVTWQEFGRKIAEELMMIRERREYQFMVHSASQRHKLFLAEYGTVAGRVSQADIASYLGITPESLSRLTAKK